jgi:hypothetical protein
MNSAAERCECGHGVGDHQENSVCQKVIHYPSEDYPCLCSGFAAPAEGEDCTDCQHPRGLHVTVTRCKPSTGELCACSKYRPAP